MKKYFLLTIILFIVTTSSAQKTQNIWYFGASLGKSEYDGDFGSATFAPSKAFYPIVGITAGRYISKSFDANLFATYGEYGYHKNSAMNFWGKKADISALLLYKFTNGYILEEDFIIQPYLTLGIGIADYSGKKIVGGQDITIPIGGGIKYPFTSTITFQYQLLFNFTSSDKHDGFVSQHNDLYATHTLGVIFSFAKKNKVAGSKCKYNKGHKR